jgi:hypothetical protein
MTCSIADLPRSFENPVTYVPTEVQEALFEKKYANMYKIFSRFGRINVDVYLGKGKNE